MDHGRVLAMLVAVLLAVAACAVSSDRTADQPVTGLHGPGTALADGLVVPQGAHLAGAVFRQQIESVVGESWVALLVVDGDPFAVWDDLAAQVRDGDIDLAMPGSADSCAWRHAQLSPTDGAYVEEDPADPNPTATLEITALAPAASVVGVECRATVAISGGAAEFGYGLSMQGDDRTPLTLTVARTYLPGSSRVPVTAWLNTMRNAAQPFDAWVAPGPDPVAPGAAAVVPETLAQPDPVSPSTPFGQEVNCFASGGPQTSMPAGSALVADGFDDGSTSVIATEDAVAAMAELGAQFADPSDPSSLLDEGTWELDDGGSAAWLEHSVSAGGGACGVLVSPDGDYLRIGRHGD